MSRKSTQQRRHSRIGSASPNASWRGEPASPEQWKVLRRIGRETGVRFPEAITRGEASAVIGARFRQDESAGRAHRRAETKRKRAAKGLRPC